MITITVINEEMGMEATQDRVIVLEDPYKSGRECVACEGKGHQGISCEECHGTGKYRGNKRSDSNCTTCSVGEGPFLRVLKYMPCIVCRGTGTSSIAIPDDQQTRPTTGIIKSIGPLCGFIRIGGEWVELPEKAKLKEGQRVAYHQHCGNIFELGAKKDIKIRVIKESEVLLRIHGIMKKTPEQGEFTELKEVGL
jgi:hypothetical protein